MPNKNLREELIKMLWELHHKAFNEDNKLALASIDTALGLAQNRPDNQIIMILHSHLFNSNNEED